LVCWAVLLVVQVRSSWGAQGYPDVALTMTEGDPGVFHASWAAPDGAAHYQVACYDPTSPWVSVDAPATTATVEPVAGGDTYCELFAYDADYNWLAVSPQVPITSHGDTPPPPPPPPAAGDTALVVDSHDTPGGSWHVTGSTTYETSDATTPHDVAVDCVGPASSHVELGSGVGVATLSGGLTRLTQPAYVMVAPGGSVSCRAIGRRSDGAFGYSDPVVLDATGATALPGGGSSTAAGAVSFSDSATAELDAIQNAGHEDAWFLIGAVVCLVGGFGLYRVLSP
jgi:hypothetical protein